jgi:D-alanine-D-alanine ligase
MLVRLERRRGRVAILHGAVAADAGPDEQDTLVQVDWLAETLRGLGFAPVPVPLSLDLGAARAQLGAIRPAFVVNIVESIDGQGRLIHLGPALLDSLGLPYTGSATEAIFQTSNKLVAKRMMAAAGIATPAWIEGEAAPGFAGPYIVKSVWEHASIGIDASSIVADPQKVPALLRRRQRRHGGDWFAERYVAGREFNLALLAGPDGMVLLPPAECIFHDYPEGKPRIVDYAAKWDDRSFEYHNTLRRYDFAPEDGPLLARLEAAALSCARLFDLHGYARVDVRVDAEGTPQVLEVNANPCLSPDAGFAAAAAAAGLDGAAVLRRIVADRVGGRQGPPRREETPAAAARAEAAAPRPR